MKTNFKSNSNTQIIGNISNSTVNDIIAGNKTNTHYHGLTSEDLIGMIEERFQHMLKK